MATQAQKDKFRDELAHGFKIATRRNAARNILAKYGFEAEDTTGSRCPKVRYERLVFLANSNLYDIPDDLASLIFDKTLDNNESRIVENAALLTFSGMHAKPAPFSIGAKTWEQSRTDAKDIIAKFDSDALGKYTHRHRPSIQQLKYLITLASDDDCTIPDAHLMLAMRGILSKDEVSQVITAATSEPFANDESEKDIVEKIDDFIAELQESAADIPEELDAAIRKYKEAANVG